MKKIWQEILSFSAKERWFVFSVMLCSFLIQAEYAVIRPVSNSVFIHFFTTAFFPYAWLATVPLNFIVITLYNRFLPKWGYFKLFSLTLFLVMGGNLINAFFLKESPVLSFLFYIWKEIYILLMFQHLWSLIHSKVDLKRAKYLYGILYGVGGIGAGFGSLIPGFLAVRMGSESLLFMTLPLYLLLFIAYSVAVKNSEVSPTFPENTSILPGLKLIKESKPLLFILSLVIFMQLAATLIDYQFNTILEKTIGDKDLRTEYFGRVLSITQCATVGMQFLGTFLIVHFLGLRGSHLLVPFALALNAIGFMFFPVFGMASFSYISIKAFDFSLFGVIKEMLYVPLKTDEKFRAKAVIDVFTYRSSKAFASFLILFCQALTGAYLLSCLSWICLAVFALWIFFVLRMQGGLLEPHRNVALR